jgi:hypothetical protein
MKQTRRDFHQTCTAGGGLLRVGVAKREVTPPVWVPYLTSADAGTCAPFGGVHDPLFARAMVLDDGRQAVALLAVDAIGYDNFVLGPGRDFTAEVRRRVTAGTGLRPEAVMLASTHAHSTPETIGLTNFRDVAGVRDWLERHVADLAAVVVEAWRQRVVARARFGKTTVTGVARNRRILLRSGKLSRRGELPAAQDIAAPALLDEELSVLWFERDTGAPHAVVLNYTAHPVVTMLLPAVSADYPGAACRLVEEQLAGATCLFTQGAAGNINSVKVTTNHADAEAIGRKLGDAALAKIKSQSARPPLSAPRLQLASERITLPPRDGAPPAGTESLARSHPTPQSQCMLRLARKLAEGPIEAEVQAMALGPVKWISLPGEPFVETGLALKQSGASFVLGYTNGWIGYLPVPRAYQEGGYEVGPGAWSRVASGSAEKLAATAKQVLRQIG